LYAAASNASRFGRKYRTSMNRRTHVMVNTTIQIAMLDCQPYLSILRVRVRSRVNVDTKDLQ
jgi:hypothetical protein